jgi:hypothetical protein
MSITLLLAISIGVSQVIRYIYIKQKGMQFFAFLCMSGKGGIRTLGTELPAVQQISNLPLSTTQPPFHGNSYE